MAPIPLALTYTAAATPSWRSPVAKRFERAEALCAPPLLGGRDVRDVRDDRCAAALLELRREVDNERYLAAMRAAQTECWIADQRRGGGSSEADRLMDGCTSETV